MLLLLLLLCVTADMATAAVVNLYTVEPSTWFRSSLIVSAANVGISAILITFMATIWLCCLPSSRKK